MYRKLSAYRLKKVGRGFLKKMQNGYMILIATLHNIYQITKIFKRIHCHDLKKHIS